jgi:predicted transcriptional regulator
MKVLLSIKPEFAERIFNGSKKYEYRKAIFKNPDVKTVVVYASSPLKRVIGEFDIETVLSDSPEILWKETHEFSGITEDFFFDYFSKSNLGFAIKIKEVRLYQNPRSLRSCYKVSPPQSFCYV